MVFSPFPARHRCVIFPAVRWPLLSRTLRVVLYSLSLRPRPPFSFAMRNTAHGRRRFVSFFGRAPLGNFCLFCVTSLIAVLLLVRHTRPPIPPLHQATSGTLDRTQNCSWKVKLTGRSAQFSKRFLFSPLIMPAHVPSCYPSLKLH